MTDLQKSRIQKLSTEICQDASLIGYILDKPEISEGGKLGVIAMNLEKITENMEELRILHREIKNKLNRKQS